MTRPDGPQPGVGPHQLVSDLWQSVAPVESRKVAESRLRSSTFAAVPVGGVDGPPLEDGPGHTVGALSMISSAGRGLRGKRVDHKEGVRHGAGC